MTPSVSTQTRTVTTETGPGLRDIAAALDERRPWLNVDLSDRLVTTEATSAQPDIAVMDISADGFRMATIGPLPIGAIFVTDLTLDDGRHVRARARVVVSREQRGGTGYVTRLEFVQE